MSVLIYGAYGFSGELIAREAVRRGVPIIVAGRNAEKARALAASLGVSHRAFGLDDPAALAAGLAGASLVLHCAGPFAHTAAQMVAACLAAGIHYLDITGEFEVFEAVAAQDAAARERGVMLMPGVGLDVVPTDCLAAHLKHRLPGATRLTLALNTNGALSHGTATTMRENLHKLGAIREGGKLIRTRVGDRTRTFDFGFDCGERIGIRAPWGDVATAWHTTGIPNIEVFACVPRGMRIGARLMPIFAPFVSLGPVQRYLQGRIEAAPAGPDAAQRARTAMWIFGEATDAEGGRAAARMRLIDGYDFTAASAVAIVDRVLRGQWARGFQTPGGVYGPDFALELPGTRREEL